MLFLPALDDDPEIETVQETMATIATAIEQFAVALGEMLAPVFEHIVDTWEVIQRTVFMGWLIKHHVPPRLAHWISKHWPLRLIPATWMYMDLLSDD